jgi:DNA-binding MarR family transcriptional regulator
VAGNLTQRGPFLLAFAVGQQLRALLARALADAPLTADEFAVYSVLFIIGPTTPTRLASDLGMPASTMSHYLRRMAERGHLDRRSNPVDGRSSLVVLTAHGRAATEACFPAFGAAITSFRANLTMPEADLLAALERMSEAIAATVATPPPVDHEPRGVDTPSTRNLSS